MAESMFPASYFPSATLATQGVPWLRDYLAGQAVAAIAAKYASNQAELVAAEAYRIADAMLKERKKPSDD